MLSQSGEKSVPLFLACRRRFAFEETRLPVIDLRRIGLPILICTDPSDPERMFVRWR
jgi:hypothetical protein